MTQPTPVAAKLDDAGDFIPFARKHLSQQQSEAAQDVRAEIGNASPRLADLFPEPTWTALVDEGRQIECVAYLAMLYESIRKTPRAGGVFRLTTAQWSEAYVDAVEWLRGFFRSVGTLAEAKAVARSMAARYRSTPAEIVKRPVAEVAGYWAASPGGKRTMHSLGALSVRQASLAKWLPSLGWPHSDSALVANIVPVALEGGGWRVAQIKGDAFYFRSDRLQGLHEAISMCSEEITRSLKASVALNQRKSGGRSERQGPDHRAGVDMKPEDLMAAFGLRGIQFGESVPQAERQAWMNNVFEALADLSDTLLIPRQWLGLGGLAVAIGARGTTSACAHYEPSLRVVNVTRMRGSGSLAHEWFHALDHRLGRHDNQPSLFAACYRAPHWFKDYGNAFGKVFVSLSAMLRTSAFREQALRIEALPRARRYWTDPEELAARGFEAWVEDKLRELGRHSPCLVHGTLERDHADRADISPYPVGRDRVTLAGYFDQVANLLRSSAGSNGRAANA